MYHRKGISSILGTLVFIGIMFSAVLPMFMMMRQADVYYEQEKMYTNQLDEERVLEDVEVYLAPTDDDYVLTLVNMGEVPVRIIRVWENEHSTDVNELLPTQTSSDLAAIDFSHAPVENDNFEIRVTTERGNTFLNENGILTYGDGEWDMEKFFLKLNFAGFFVQIKVTDVQEGIVLYDKWETIGIGQQIEVPAAGADYFYHVYVRKLFGGTMHDANVAINWPPETFVDVYPE